MEIFMSALTAVGGLAFFLFGMNMLGASLEKAAGGKMQQALEKMTSNVVKSLLLGILVTAAIQSSSATTVIVVGLVNAGILRLRNAIGVIMGANIGTTVTSLILSLADPTHAQTSNMVLNLFKPATFTPVIALVAIVILMTAKKSRTRLVSEIMFGFAILFNGMMIMTNALEPLSELPAFSQIFQTLSNPFVGLLAGTLITAIIQSSSASVAILQTAASTGLVPFSAAVPIILGQNIGTCVTAMLSSVGTNKNARRAAVVHLSFNIIGTVVWLTLFESANAIFRFAFVSTAIDTFHIALIHSIFNLACTLMLLPCCGLLEKLSYRLIPETDHPDTAAVLDERLFATPAIALVKSEELTKRMAADAELALHESLQAVLHFTPELAASVRRREDDTDRYEDTLGTFLVHLATQPMSEQDSVESSMLLHLIGDFERVADHAVNIIESAEELKEKGVSFTPPAQKELQTMLDAVGEIVDLTSRAFLQDDLALARQVEPLEQVIDKLKDELRTNHIARLQRGECSLAAGFVLSDLLTNLERVSDHCSNIAGCLLDMKNERIDLHKYLGDVKSGSNEFLLQYNAFEEKYKLEA